MISLAIASTLNLDTGAVAGTPVTERHLANLRGSFADAGAYVEALARGNPLLYTVSTVAPAAGDGQLHYGLGRLMPGRIGAEYFMTRGHLHSRREAAEVYVGLRGEGCLLLEDERTGESRLLPLRADSVVYVPGHTAHRTINTGTEPLVYLGVYPAQAGHDYATIASRNFKCVVVERGGQAVMMERRRP